MEDKIKDALEIIAELTGTDLAQASKIVEMRKIWKQSVVKARCLGGIQTFSNFETAWKGSAIESLKDEITEEVFDSLCTIGYFPLTESCRKLLTGKALDLFSDYVRTGAEKEKRLFLDAVKGEADDEQRD